MSDCRHLRAIDSAARAAGRAAALLRRKLGRGTSSLQVVACLAPLLGMLSSMVLLMGALRSYRIWGLGCNYGDCAGGPEELFVPLLLSLPVAIVACAGFHWLRYQVETFDLEMRTATFDLLNDLARRTYPAVPTISTAEEKEKQAE